MLCCRFSLAVVPVLLSCLSYYRWLHPRRWLSSGELPGIWYVSAIHALWSSPKAGGNVADWIVCTKTKASWRWRSRCIPRVCDCQAQSDFQGKRVRHPRPQESDFIYVVDVLSEVSLLNVRVLPHRNWNLDRLQHMITRFSIDRVILCLYPNCSSSDSIKASDDAFHSIYKIKHNLLVDDTDCWPLNMQPNIAL